ncbi:hypothetical protein G7Y89_g7018 [Cudoniella acicularis]|uniref:Uncharacterized protein n=1 Tax=Cudoniella acicularis TaxID=354080 RepID=A0A8H4RJB3_9HELO|nr:hypothetical protein G7Y89_g7018 [Cudoniella acicularis]
MAWASSNSWHGLDGNWSTWNITVGIPSQSFHVLASTNARDLTLPFASYCATTPRNSLCSSARGVALQNHPISNQSYGYSPEGSRYWNVEEDSDMMWSFINVEEEFADIPQPSNLWPDLAGKLAGLGSSDEVAPNQTQLVFGWRSKVEKADPEEGSFLGAIGLKAIPSRHWMWPTGRHYTWRWDDKIPSFIQRLGADTELTMGYAYTPGAYYRGAEKGESEKGSGKENITIVLPYQSFDLSIRRSWDDDKPKAYFPIQIAEPGEVSVLGRSFMQEVYLIVNYFFYNFTISQIALETPENPSPHTQTLEKIPFGLDSHGAGIFDKLILFALIIVVFGVIYLGKPFLVLAVPVLVIFMVFYVPRWWRLRVRENELERLWKGRHSRAKEDVDSDSGEL